MKVRFNRVPLYLTLALVPLAIVGCGESKDNLSVNPSPQPAASAPFPSPSVPPTLNSPSKVALTRPTNPDDRLRVIKSGRPDPFGSVGPVASLTSANVNSGSGYYYSQQPSSSRYSNFDRYLKGANGSSSTPSSSPSFPPSPGQSGGLSGSMPDLTLPSLPKAPEPAAVKVSGILVVGGEPRAIVQAPDEPTSRTVGIGDSLAGGKLFVKNIDTSNRTEPKVIFQQGDFEFSVAVGRDPVLTASAMPSSPLRGLTLPKIRP
jgi:hypothetical protein